MRIVLLLTSGIIAKGTLTSTISKSRMSMEASILLSLNRQGRRKVSGKLNRRLKGSMGQMVEEVIILKKRKTLKLIATATTNN